MLAVQGVVKHYGTTTILENVSFSINRGECVGLIGPNGGGKTTLLRIIAGLEHPDEGKVIFSPKDHRLGYLPQGLQAGDQTAAGDLVNPAARELEQVEAELARISEQIAISEGDHTQESAEAYDKALDRLTILSSLVEGGVLEAILAALGLGDLDLSTPVGKLSGGEKTRLGLAKVLLSDPQLLLLDEPTNHLDIEMLEWLEEWLTGFQGGVLLVSHDRTFLDRTVDRILDLDPETHTTRDYAGNYSFYLEQYLVERKKQLATYRDQVYEIRRMRQDIARSKEQARRTEQATTDSSQRRYAKKVARKAKAREKRLERNLGSEKRVEKPRQSWRMSLEFSPPKHLGEEVLGTESLSVGYPDYEPLLNGLNLHVRAGARVAFTGPNGSGKTSLIRTIAGYLQPLEGQVRIGASVHLGYLAQEQEILDFEQSALETIRQAAPISETEARTFLHHFLFSGDDPLRPAKDLSFGERARLALAVLVAEGSNFLLLDEPINHLDIPSRAHFESALSHYEGTVLAVVHDRYFIERFASEIWVVEDRGVKVERKTGI